MTGPPEDHGGESAHEETLNLLVVECVDRCDHEGPDALAAMCREHPEFAAELRAAVAPLLDVVVHDTPGIRDLAETPDEAAEGADSGELLGATIGGYEIVREVGRGGMGIVFEARDPDLGRTVALKLLRGAAGLDDESRERFRREAAAAGSLQHENLVRVFGYGLSDGCPWLAMEFITDAPLGRALALLRRRVTGSLDEAVGLVLEDAAASRDEAGGAGPPPPPQIPPAAADDSAISLSPREIRRRVELVLEVAAGLHYAHRNGIVHRDVKPANILVREDGRPVLTDFGLAVSRDLPQLTRHGAFAGTPFYASPEQAAGRLDAVNAQSDVFALGVTLYELLTLRRPFEGQTSREVLAAIEREEPNDPARYVPDVPADLAAVTLMALAKDQRERYADMQAFADDLRAFLELRPVTARRASSLQRLRRWARREPLRAALAVVVSLSGLVVAGVVGFAISQQPLVHAAEMQQREDAAAEATMTGFAAFRERDFALARASFDSVLAEFPDRDAAVVGRVMTEVTPTSGDAALAMLQPYLDRTPDNPVLLRLQSLCLDQSKRFDEARAIREKLGEPSLPLELFLEACSKLRHVVGRSDDDKREAARRVSREAFDLLNAAIAGSEHPVPIYYYYQADMVVSRLGDEIIARRLADTLVRLWPDEAFAWQAAGEALEWFDLEGAGACYEKAYALDGTNLRRRVRVADNLYRRGLGDLAEAEMLECLRLGAEEAVVYEVLARLHAARDDFEGAVPYARKAVAISLETNRTAYIGYAKLLMDMLERAGRPDEAFAYARTAIAEEPQLTDFHELLINIHLNRKEFDEAAELSSDMIARSPDDHYAWFTRGRVLWAQGRLDETIEAFRKCCALKPDDVPAWTNLAMVLARREEHLPEAIRTARKAVVLSGYTQAHPLWVLGTALLRAGELDDAEHVYRTGLDIESLEGNRNPRLRSELENGLKTVRARMARADESGKR